MRRVGSHVDLHTRGDERFNQRAHRGGGRERARASEG